MLNVDENTSADMLIRDLLLLGLVALLLGKKDIAVHD